MLVICFEGGNGSGKSTQLRLLREYLESSGFRCKQLRDPGISDDSDCHQLRQICTRYPFKSPFAPLYAFCMARSELIEEIKRIHAANECDVLLLDRFELSTYAYQVAPFMDKGLSFDEATAAVRAIAGSIGNFIPDFLIFCDSDPKIAFTRAINAGKSPDQYEAQGIQFQRDLVDRYRTFFNSKAFGVKNIWVGLDDTKTPEQISEVYRDQVLADARGMLAAGSIKDTLFLSGN